MDAVSCFFSILIYNNYLYKVEAMSRFTHLIKITFAAVSLGAVMLTAPSLSSAEPVLRVSAIPDEAPTELQRKFKPLGDYLEKKLGMKVEFTPVTDYAASVEGLVNNKLDMVWFGGFTFVQAKVRSHQSGHPSSAARRGRKIQIGIHHHQGRHQ